MQINNIYTMCKMLIPLCLMQNFGFKSTLQLLGLVEKLSSQVEPPLTVFGKKILVHKEV